MTDHDVRQQKIERARRLARRVEFARNQLRELELDLAQAKADAEVAITAMLSSMEPSFRDNLVRN
jgi:hypothetical protein